MISKAERVLDFVADFNISLETVSNEHIQGIELMLTERDDVTKSNLDDLINAIV